jgi:hypothetical protein
MRVTPAAVGAVVVVDDLPEPVFAPVVKSISVFKGPSRWPMRPPVFSYSH